MSGSAMSWSTMRVRNGDGSSTVYKVHESLGGSAAEQFVLGGPPSGHYGNPISPTSVMVPQEVFGSPCGHHLHTASPHSFGGPFGPHHQLGAASPNVIVVESGTDDDGGGYDESAEQYAGAPVTATPSKSRSKSRRRSKRPEWCTLTTNVCIMGGVLAGLAFVIGYMYLIEAIVDRTVPTHHDSPRYGHKDFPKKEEDPPIIQIVKDGKVVESQQLRGSGEQILTHPYVYVLPGETTGSRPAAQVIEVGREAAVPVESRGGESRPEPKEKKRQEIKDPILAELNSLHRDYSPDPDAKSRNGVGENV